MQPEIRSLTSAIASGDTEAFTRFYRRWFDAMYAEAARATGRDESFCLDVVQDAMMRVIRSITPMSSELDLRRWLRVVVQSCAYDRLRQEARRRDRERQAAAAREASRPTPPGPDDPRTRIRWLEEQLRTLDHRSGQLLLMRHRFGWTLREIGNAVGLKPGAVDGRLRRLLSTLRRRAREESTDD
ncbi:MAG: RNA polymerase sigma factor [Planctomycetota bacterium]